MKLLRGLSITGIILGLIMIVSSLLLLKFPISPQEVSISSDENNNSKQISTPLNKSNEIVIKEEIPTVQKVNTLEESGWIPYWAFDLGIESLKSNSDIIKSVSPVLYSINSSGNLQKNNIQALALNEGMKYIQENNIRLIPTIGSNNFNNTDLLFSDESKYKKNIEDILKEVETNNYDGIDLDYESIHTQHKEAFVNYLTLLADELHKKNKKLSVTVFAQWEDVKYTDHEETRIVQDYSRIGKIADEVKIMAYDYTSSSSTTPGPIGPINWIEEVLKYARIHIPKEKIVLGIHLYSYAWDNSKLSALTNTTVSNMFNKGVKGTYKEEIAEGYATYNCNGENKCEMYYQTKEGIKERRELAKRYEIKGVIYWRLGGELDLLK